MVTFKCLNDTIKLTYPEKPRFGTRTSHISRSSYSENGSKNMTVSLNVLRLLFSLM